MSAMALDIHIDLTRRPIRSRRDDAYPIRRSVALQSRKRRSRRSGGSVVFQRQGERVGFGRVAWRRRRRRVYSAQRLIQMPRRRAYRSITWVARRVRSRSGEWRVRNIWKRISCATIVRRRRRASWDGVGRIALKWRRGPRTESHPVRIVYGRGRRRGRR